MCSLAPEAPLWGNPEHHYRTPPTWSLPSGEHRESQVLCWQLQPKNRGWNGLSKIPSLQPCAPLEPGWGSERPDFFCCHRNAERIPVLLSWIQSQAGPLLPSPLYKAFQRARHSPHPAPLPASGTGVCCRVLACDLPSHPQFPHLFNWKGGRMSQRTPFCSVMHHAP